MYTTVPVIVKNSYTKKLDTVKAQKALCIKRYLYPKTSIKPFFTEHKRNRKKDNSDDGVVTHQK